MSKNPVAVTSEKRDMSDSHIPGGMSWRAGLDLTEKGDNVKNTLPNARRVLQNHTYLKDLFGWSELDEDVMLLRELPKFDGLNPPRSQSGYPCRLEEKYVTYMRDLLSSLCQNSFGDKDVFQACSLMGMQNPYNPCRTYLKSLNWDGKHRLDQWLTHGFGAEDTDLNSNIGKMFLIAAVRRIVFHGYKFDSMLVLEGEKGIRKSSGIKELFGEEYFLEGLGNISKEETVQKLAGMWGVEIPEGKGFLHADAETQKAFLSTVVDTYRRPWDKRATSVPRTALFIMTTNAYSYLQEAAGDRRYWSVLCGALCDIQWIKENRDQLWAEAFYEAIRKEPTGEWVNRTYMNDEEMAELTEAQESRVVVDPWEDVIRSVLYGNGDMCTTPQVSTLQIMHGILDIPIERRDRHVQTKIGLIMKGMGWEKQRVVQNGQRVYVFVRPNET